jgi:hypothetical protein
LVAAVICCSDNSKASQVTSAIPSSADQGYFDIRYAFVGTRLPGKTPLHFSGVNPFRQIWQFTATPVDLPPPNISFLSAGTSTGSTSGGSAFGNQAAFSGRSSCGAPYAKSGGINTELSVTSKSLPNCLYLLLSTYKLMKQDEAKLALYEQAFVDTEDALLTDHPDLRNTVQYSNYLRDVNSCFFPAPGTSSINACLADSDLGQLSLTSAVAKIDAVALLKDYNTIQTQYQIIAIMAAKFITAPDQQTLGQIQSSLNTEQVTIGQLVNYAQNTLPLTVQSTNFIHESATPCRDRSQELPLPEFQRPVAIAQATASNARILMSQT